MMNAKQEAVARAKEVLSKEQSMLRRKIQQNKWDMAKLAKENAINKRELGVLNEAIRALDNKPKKIKKPKTLQHNVLCECQECCPISGVI